MFPLLMGFLFRCGLPAEEAARPAVDPAAVGDVGALEQARADVATANATSSNLDAQITLQHANITEAQAGIVSSDAALKFSRQDYARYQRLMAADAGTLQRTQQAEATLQEDAAQLSRSQAALVAAHRPFVGAPGESGVGDVHVIWRPAHQPDRVLGGLLQASMAPLEILARARDHVAHVDRLAGLGVVSHAGPVAFAVDLLVRDGTLDHEDDWLKLAAGCLVKGPHEVFAGLVGQHLVVQMHFRQAGDRAEQDVLQAWQGRVGH